MKSSKNKLMIATAFIAAVSGGYSGKAGVLVQDNFESYNTGAFVTQKSTSTDGFGDVFGVGDNTGNQGTSAAPYIGFGYDFPNASATTTSAHIAPNVIGTGNAHSGTKALDVGPTNVSNQTTYYQTSLFQDTELDQTALAATPLVTGDVFMKRTDTLTASATQKNSHRTVWSGIEIYGNDADGDNVLVGGIGLYFSYAAGNNKPNNYEFGYLTNGTGGYGTAGNDSGLNYYYTFGTGAAIGTAVPNSAAYIDYTITADFSAKTFSVFYNGLGVVGIPFSASAGLGDEAVTLTDVDMVVEGESNDHTYFDDFTVSADAPVPVPEASSVALLAPAGLLLSRRRRA